MGIEPSISVINYELDEKFARDIDLECVVLLKVRIFFFFFFLGRWEVAMLH